MAEIVRNTGTPDVITQLEKLHQEAINIHNVTYTIREENGLFIEAVLANLPKERKTISLKPQIDVEALKSATLTSSKDAWQVVFEHPPIKYTEELVELRRSI